MNRQKRVDSITFPLHFEVILSIQQIPIVGVKQVGDQNGFDVNIDASIYTRI